MEKELSVFFSSFLSKRFFSLLFFQGQRRPSASSPTTSIQTHTTTRAPFLWKLYLSARYTAHVLSFLLDLNSTFHFFVCFLYPCCPGPSGYQDNVVCLSPRLAQSLGNMGQVCVCVRVTSTIHLIDPTTLQSKCFYCRHPVPDWVFLPSPCF